MKKFFWVIVLVGFSMMSTAHADEKVLSTVTAPSAKKDPAADAKREEMIKMIEKKKVDLNGTEWKVTLTPADHKEKAEEDVLTFQNGQVVSKNFLERGFTATNYTISIPEGSDIGVWETMQTSSNSKEGVIFIRGEWKDDQMRGIVSQQVEGGKSSKDYNFKTTSKAKVSPSTTKSEDKKTETGQSNAAEGDVQEDTQKTAASTNALVSLESSSDAKKPSKNTHK